MFDLVEDEEHMIFLEQGTRDLLLDYDFPSDEVPVIRGSALKALEGDAKWETKIIELIGQSLPCLTTVLFYVRG